MSEKKIVKLGVPAVIFPAAEEAKLFAEDTRRVWAVRNRYMLYEDLVNMDPELFGAIHAQAQLIASCIKGFTVKYGETLEPIEQEIHNELKKLEKDLFLYLYDIAFKVIRDGDAVYKIDMVAGSGFRQLVYLPMAYLTAREHHPDALELETTPIQYANYYVLNEGQGDKQQVFAASECVHFNFGRYELVDDIHNRKTLGIWNTSPLEPLKAKLLWKHCILLNDMLWRSVNVPRRHHKLPSEAFDPDKFTGATREERIAKAKAAAKAALDDYVEGLRLHEVERDIITLDDVEIEVIEPKLKYTDPNELLEQIDQSIWIAIGVPLSALAGARGRATFATELVASSFYFHRVKHLAQMIGSKLIRIARMHLLEIDSKFQPHFDKIGIDIYTELFLREQARVVATLAALGIFSPAELRAMMGFPPQPPERVVAAGLKTLRSPQQMLTPELKTSPAAPEHPVTPESREQRQKTEVTSRA